MIEQEKSEIIYNDALFNEPDKETKKTEYSNKDNINSTTNVSKEKINYSVFEDNKKDNISFQKGFCSFILGHKEVL